jgi:hypothetical protein
VAPGCRALTNSFAFEGSINVFGSTLSLKSRTLAISEVVDTEVLSRVAKLTEEEIRSLALIGSREGLTIKDIRSEFTRQDLYSTSFWSVTTVVLVLLFAVSCICVLRARHLRKRISEQGWRWLTRGYFAPAQDDAVRYNNRGGDVEMRRFLPPGASASAPPTTNSNPRLNSQVVDETDLAKALQKARISKAVEEALQKEEDQNM